MADYFIHANAICESQNIGPRTRIWAFTHVLPGARIGSDCNICDHVFVENDVLVGDRVTVKSGVQLWDGITLADDVFVGPNATFTNDPFPRSKQYPNAFARTIVAKGASIGGNATILPGIQVGADAMIGAGAVVTSDVPRNAIVVGNPGRIVGYVGTSGKLTTSVAAVQDPSAPAVKDLAVSGVRVFPLRLIRDLRGRLAVAEFGTDLPFQPKRVFVVYEVPSKHVRGEHAHRVCQQLLVCVRGACAVVVDDGKAREEVALVNPGIGLYVPPMIWATQYKYTEDAVLVVFASEHYDERDYIRDYDDYLAELSHDRHS